jgi:hypothetical protein
VVDGVECQLEGEEQTETVFDLQTWLRNQFLKLKRAGDKDFHAIWLGEDEAHFVSIASTPTKYKVMWSFDECGRRAFDKGMDTFVGSTDLAKICDEIALEASLVEDLTWTHPPREQGHINIRYLRRRGSAG